jgi:hypothetical protein
LRQLLHAEAISKIQRALAEDASTLSGALEALVMAATSGDIIPIARAVTKSHARNIVRMLGGARTLGSPARGTDEWPIAPWARTQPFHLRLSGGQQFAKPMGRYGALCARLMAPGRLGTCRRMATRHQGSIGSVLHPRTCASTQLECDREGLGSRISIRATIRNSTSSTLGA